MENKTLAAFPVTESKHESPEILVCNEKGLTKREYIATKAMQALVSAETESSHFQNKGLLVNSAIQYADELLKQLEQ